MKRKDIVNEIDNGPRGRVQTDKINYGQTRNMSGYTSSKDNLARTRADNAAYEKQRRDAQKARDARYAEPKKIAPKINLDVVWSKVEDVVGQTVPDGDPIDWLAPWLEKQGVKGLDIGDVLTKAARKHGYRDIYEYYQEIVQHYNELQGESVQEDTPGYVKYEEMKDRLASILIKLYDSGKDLGEISAMADQVAAKLGYDPEDKIFQQAWRSSITDINLDTNFGDDEPFDYTDHSMRQGEMGRNSIPLSWSDLGEEMSTDDKIAILEEFFAKNTLIESVDEQDKQYFLSLIKISDTPIKNKEYIVVPLILVGQNVRPIDKIEVMEFIQETNNGSMFKTIDEQEKTLPNNKILHNSVYHTFTFLTNATFEKFKTALNLKFDVSLPSVSISNEEYQPQSALGKALWRDLGKKKQISQVQKQRNQERWAKNPHNPANKNGVDESKEDKIAKLRKDYADKMRWSREEKQTKGADRSGHLAGAQKIKHHLKKQYGVDVNENTTEAKGIVDKNFGKVRKNDVVQTDLKPGDPVIGDMGRGTSVFGKVKRIGREHIFMISNAGEELAFRPEHIEYMGPSYWLDKLDAESARRQKFKKEDADLNERAFVRGDVVNHTFFPQGGTVIRREGNIIFVRDNKTHKIFRMSIMNLLQGNLADEDIEEAEGTISNIRPGQSATVSSTDANTGVTQSTTVDLKKNPTALSKDPATGKLKLNIAPQSSGPTAPTANTAPKTGDRVELDTTSSIKKLAGI